MKKGIKSLAAAALALSALTPVVASASTSVENGVYTTTNFYTLDQFKALTTAEKTGALTSSGAVVVIGGKVYEATDVLSATDAALPGLAKDAATYTTADGSKLESGKPLAPAPAGELKVESVSAINAQKIKVTFNKEVDKTSAELPANYVISGKDKNGTALAFTTPPALQTDKKSVVITLDEVIANNSTVGLSVLPIDSADASESTESFSTTIKFADNSKPTLAETESTDLGEVTFTFSEQLDNTTLIAANVKVYDANGKLLTEGASDDYQFTASSDDTGFVLSGLTEGDKYKVEVVNVKDLVGNLTSPNFISTTVTPKFTEDKVAPKVTDITTKGLDTIVVHVSEALTNTGGATAVYLDITGNVLVAGSSTPLALDTAAPQVYNRAAGTVEVKLDSTTLADEGTVATLTVDSFTDLATNSGTAYTKTVGFTQISSVTKSEVVTRAGKDYVKVTFDRAINVDNTVATTGTLTTSDNVRHAVAIAAGTADVSSSPSETNVLYIEIPSTTETGKLEIALPKLLVKTLENDTKVTVDYSNLAPKVVTFAEADQATDTKAFIVEFDKDMDQSALNAAAYTIDGVQVFESAIFDGNKKTVKLTTKKNAIKENANYDFAVATSVKAANGTALAKKFEDEVSLTENTAPTVLAAKISADGATITLTFSEAVTNASADKNDYEVLVGGTKFTAAQTASGTATSVVLTLDTAIDLSALNSTITLNTLSTTDIVDAAANKVAVKTGIAVVR